MAPDEQQRQVVASRPCRQVPPVAYFFPDAATGVGFRGVKSSDWSPGLLGVREGGQGPAFLGFKERGRGLGSCV